MAGCEIARDVGGKEMSGARGGGMGRGAGLDTKGQFGLRKQYGSLETKVKIGCIILHRFNYLLVFPSH